MGKSLIIKGADFSQNAIIEEIELDFTSLTVQPYNIGESSDTVRLTCPTSNEHPSFYEVDLTLYPNVSKLKFINQTSKSTRLLFTNDALPSSASNLEITNYFASTKEDSYYNNISGDGEFTINIPSGTEYIYIRKNTSSVDTTPASAILI